MRSSNPPRWTQATLSDFETYFTWNYFIKLIKCLEQTLKKFTSLSSTEWPGFVAKWMCRQWVYIKSTPENKDLYVICEVIYHHNTRKMSLESNLADRQHTKNIKPGRIFTCIIFHPKYNLITDVWLVFERPRLCRVWCNPWTFRQNRKQCCLINHKDIIRMNICGPTFSNLLKDFQTTLNFFDHTAGGFCGIVSPTGFI